MLLHNHIMFSAGESYKFLTELQHSSGMVYALGVRGKCNVDLPELYDENGCLYFFMGSIVSGELPAGSYKLIIVETTAGNSRILDSGSLRLAENLITPTDEKDFRSHAEKMLESIEAYMLGRAEDHQIDHLISQHETRSITRMSALDLEKLAQKYRSRVAHERNPENSLLVPKKIQVAFK